MTFDELFYSVDNRFKDSDDFLKSLIFEHEALHDVKKKYYINDDNRVVIGFYVDYSNTYYIKPSFKDYAYAFANKDKDSNVIKMCSPRRGKADYIHVMVEL